MMFLYTSQGDAGFQKTKSQYHLLSQSNAFRMKIQLDFKEKQPQLSPNKNSEMVHSETTLSTKKHTGSHHSKQFFHNKKPPFTPPTFLFQLIFCCSFG